MPNIIKIGKKTLSKESSCFIIAEAGSNHDGSFKQAIALIDLAVKAQADAVKFQVFTAGKIAAKTNHKIAQLDSNHGKDLYELYKNYEMPKEWVPKLKKYCDDKGIIFLATPFDEEAADLLKENDIEAYKIASFELVHIPLLKYVAKMGKPIILSTGMANMGEIELAINTIKQEGNNEIIVLHCGISYPMPFDQVNIKAMNSIESAFNVLVGYSDHTEGTIVPITAVASGAKVIEKHYTIDKTLNGPDHGFALGPKEIMEMVKSIRITESVMGDGIKAPSKTELIHKDRGRRSLFINKDMRVNDIISMEDIEVLRPGIGIEPKYLNQIVGRRLRQNIEKYEPLTWETL